MKKNQILFLWMLLLPLGMIKGDFVGTMKGIEHGFESFGKGVKNTIGSAKFWKGLGRGFGLAPTGYVYSCTVVNDTSWPIDVTTQEYASFMGATFPKGGRAGINVVTLRPFQQDYSIKNKEYYFEVRIGSSRLSHSGTSSGMPYTSDALYVQNCIQLPLKQHSTKMDYFHVYMGKKMENGKYIHQPMVEYLGYSDPANPKDKNASVKQVNFLTGNPALVIYNSTNQPIQIGYSSQQKVGSTTLKKSDCDLIWDMVPENSFALRTGDQQVEGSGENKTASYTFALGTFGVFDTDVEETSEIYTFPNNVFDGYTYTLGIYQDEGQPRQIGIQALQAAHDVPANRVRDITPITCVFWYQEVKQLSKSRQKGMTDMPGKVWIIAPGDQGIIKTEVKAGEALKFRFHRPKIGQKSWLYFVYVDEQNAEKEQEFIDKFAQGLIGQDALNKYKTQSQKQFDKAKSSLTTITTFQLGAKVSSAKATVQVPEDLLIAAIQGALKVDGGEIIDRELGVSGFLLGADVFLSEGVGGTTTFYYKLPPSSKNGNVIIKSAVENLYTMGTTTAPDGMPIPTTYTEPSQAVLAKTVGLQQLQTESNIAALTTEQPRAQQAQDATTVSAQVAQPQLAVTVPKRNVVTQGSRRGKHLAQKQAARAKN